jgi:hypothetical protein
MPGKTPGIYFGSFFVKILLMLWKIPTVKIEPNGLTITNSVYTDRDLFVYHNNKIENLSSRDSSTYSNFSLQSQQRLKRAFHLLIAISKEKEFYDRHRERSVKFLLTFTTLTLSANQGIHTDYDIKKQLLDNYLQNLRHSQHLNHYIWRAEPQRNGNLHFHITANQAFDYQYVRDTWNNAQKRLGFIDLFNEKHHHINPNSTDIHSVRKIEKAGAYIAKYVAKIRDDARDIKGKVWDCSQSLKPKAKCQIYCQGNDIDHLQQLEEKYSDRIYTADYFKFVPMTANELKFDLPDSWNRQYKEYLTSIKGKHSTNEQ